MHKPNPSSHWAVNPQAMWNRGRTRVLRCKAIKFRHVRRLRVPHGGRLARESFHDSKHTWHNPIQSSRDHITLIDSLRRGNGTTTTPFWKPTSHRWRVSAVQMQEINSSCKVLSGGGQLSVHCRLRHSMARDFRSGVAW
ncbi:hypothetical protein BDQ94DRAFT_139717 [Aspergillus welwitschiae]|uniref:Uncharacterized protein n=1 Tax=Aspergillus welwitschiae TaxID=1341132 RepID=A0A3F3Q8P7_9EURO|nr:hypothetical protein BDQ94DRAFT_139717 [Aspergillus welwitschiae]RDH35505.1 hypothetical protein BDQ94DRAFT_139717 [Aspergillus welwitschiae]